MPDVTSIQAKKKRKSVDGETSTMKKSKKSTKGKTAEQKEADEAMDAPSPVETDTEDINEDEDMAAVINSDASGSDSEHDDDDEAPRKRSKKMEENPLPEIEIDSAAPAPLSKAQIRAAKKEAKTATKSGKPLPTEEEKIDAPKKEKKSKKPKKINSIWIGNMSFRTQPETLRSWIENGLQKLLDEGDEGMKKAAEGAVKRVQRREARLVEKKAERKARLEGKEVTVEKVADEDSEGSEDDSDEDMEEKKPSTSTAVAQSLGPASKTWITRVNMPLKPGKGKLSDNKGFAYVDFLTPKLQRCALKLSEKMLEGRKLLIKLGDDHAPTTDARTPKPPTIVAGSLPKKQPHNASTSLFMGNLDFLSTEEEIRDMVETNAIKTAQGPLADGKGRKRKFTEDGEGEENKEGDDDVEVVKADTDDEASDDEKPAKAAPAKGSNATKSRGGEVSGLLKVRVGQFQDTGRCKGFAFLDFKTVESATFALANRANHFMRGRKLVLQYASQSATARSSRAKRMEIDGPIESGDAEGGDADQTPAERPRFQKPRTDNDAQPAESVLASYSRPKGPPADARRSFGAEKKDTRGRKWEVSGRPRPGAALAMAKRENVAIVAGGVTGKKITFDD